MARPNFLIFNALKQMTGRIIRLSIEMAHIVHFHEAVN